MSKVFMFIIALIVANVFLAWTMTEIGKEATAIDQDLNLNATGTSTEQETKTGVLAMLWQVATFSIEGIPTWCQVLVFGTMNTCMAVAIFFVLRGVG